MDSLINYVYRNMHSIPTLEELKESIGRREHISTANWMMNSSALKLMASLSDLDPDSIFYDKQKDKFYRHTLRVNQDPDKTVWEILNNYHWNGLEDYESDNPDIVTFFSHRYAILDAYRIGVNGLPGKAFDGLQLAACQSATPTRLIPDLQYKLLSYIPSHALKLPITDQVRVLKEILGVEVPIHRTTPLLKLIVKDNWLNMSADEFLEPWLIRKYGVAEFCLRDIMSKLFGDLNIDYINYALLTPRFISLVKRFQKHQDVSLLSSQINELINKEEIDVEFLADFIETYLSSHLAKI